jgi:hypothetical protein
VGELQHLPPIALDDYSDKTLQATTSLFSVRNRGQ